MKNNKTFKHKKYGRYGRLPDNVYETYDPGDYPAIYRRTNALIFPLKLIDDEEVIPGADFL